MSKVRCNVCGDELPGKDQTAFLCQSCVRHAPLPLLLRYRRACNAMRMFRRVSQRPATEAPPHLLDELAASWRDCADAARAAYYAERERAA